MKYGGNFIVKNRCAQTALNKDQMFIREAHRFYNSMLIMNSVGTGKTLAIVSIVWEFVHKKSINSTDIVAIIIMKSAQHRDFASNVELYAKCSTIPGVKLVTYMKFHETYQNLLSQGHRIGMIIVDEFHIYSHSIFEDSISDNHKSIMTLIEIPSTVYKIAVTATPMIDQENDLIVTASFLTSRKDIKNVDTALQVLISTPSIGIFCNINERKYPTVQVVCVDAPEKYHENGKNSFGRTYHEGSLYTPCVPSKDISLYNGYLNSIDVITKKPCKVTPNGCMFEIMARALTSTSPAFAFLLRLIGQNIDDYGVTTIYFDNLKALLYKFASYLRTCGMSLLTKDSAGTSCNFLIMTGDAKYKYKPSELYVEANSKYNISGDKVKVVLFTSAYKEGVSFLNVLRIATLQTWNSTTENQALGRSFRINSYTHLRPYIENLKKYVVDGEIMPYTCRIVIADTYSTNSMVNLVDTKTKRIGPIIEKLIQHSVKYIETQSIEHATTYNSNHLVVKTNYEHNVTLREHDESALQRQMPKTFVMDAIFSKMFCIRNLDKKINELMEYVNEISRKRNVYGMQQVAEVNDTLIELINQQILTINELNQKKRIDYSITPLNVIGDIQQANEKISVYRSQIEDLKNTISELHKNAEYNIVKFELRDRCTNCGEQVLRKIDNRQYHSKCLPKVHQKYRYAIMYNGITRAFHSIHSNYSLINGPTTRLTCKVSVETLYELFDQKYPDLECEIWTDNTNKR